jgi:UDPglucose 6-dehydrogenase
MRSRSRWPRPAGSILKAYDPVANGRARALLPPRVQYCRSADQAAEGADAIVIVTEWREFAEIDFRKLKAKVLTPVVIDLRNFLNEEQVQLNGFRYFGIGGRHRQAFEKVSLRSVVSTRSFRSDARNRTADNDLPQEKIAAAE